MLRIKSVTSISIVLLTLLYFIQNSSVLAGVCYICTGYGNCRYRHSACCRGCGECDTDADCETGEPDPPPPPPPPPPPVPRTISGSLFETSDPSSCSSVGPLGVSGLTAIAYNGATQVGSTASVAADGTYIISGVTDGTSLTSVTYNGSLSNVSTTYVPACVRDNSAAVTCNLSGGGAVANCTPANGLATQDMIINMGFTRSFNSKWFSVLDADLYAGSITADVGTAPLGGFAPYLINRVTATSSGGFGFSGSAIETESTGTDVTEYGGRAEDLSTAAGINFEDKWLNRFSFVPPVGSDRNVPGSNNFLAGRVYSVTVDEMNNILSRRSNYSIVAANESAYETAIVYATGGGTIHIDQPFTTDDPARQVLVLVTDANVEISENVLLSPTSALTLTSPSQIDLNIISAGDVSTGSRFDSATGTPDNPLVINGTVIAKGTINFDRNLGSTDNPSFPGETIRFYPYLGTLIQRYEAQYGTAGPYTGLAVYDVQFDFNQ